MTREIIYHLNNLTQRYNDRSVLQIKQLDIYAGEILAVVGPSGAGKSTLLRHLNFLESPTHGTITFADMVFTGNPLSLAIRRKITTVFQKPVLLNRSVADNVAYGLKLRGQNKRSARQVVQAALEQVGLSNLAMMPARNLSGGEAQRVALARALVVEPTVLLMDEPTANLDPYNVKLIEKIIVEVNQAYGTTIVLVTHNTFQAKRVAHRTALMLEGCLIEVVDTETFFKAPGDPRTAAFVQGDVIY